MKKNRKKKTGRKETRKDKKKRARAHYQIQTAAISAVINKYARRLEGLDMHNYLYC